MIRAAKPYQSNSYNGTNSEVKRRVKIQDLYEGEFRQSGGTLMGKCPFHDDSNPSFAIYVHTNSWNCFGGCGGGSVIDFYMKLKDVDFKTAIAELEKL